MDEQDQERAAPARRTEGRVLAGMGLGLLVQSSCIVLPLLLGWAIGAPRSLDGVAFLMVAGFFGITQWLILGPLLWIKRQQSSTVKGLLVVGGLGFLVSSACGVMMYSR